jgi:hypothetical protein
MTLSLLASTDADEIKDVANYGCAGGVNGFIYYSETSKFFDEHEDEIYYWLNDARVLYEGLCKGWLYD